MCVIMCLVGDLQKAKSKTTPHQITLCSIPTSILLKASKEKKRQEESHASWFCKMLCILVFTRAIRFYLCLHLLEFQFNFSPILCQYTYISAQVYWGGSNLNVYIIVFLRIPVKLILNCQLKISIAKFHLNMFEQLLVLHQATFQGLA